MMRKKILFVDLPQIMNGVRPDYVELFKNLSEEFDEIRAFANLKENSMKILIAIANTGILPIGCPCDPDPIIVNEILCTVARNPDIEMVGLLSGDNGYFTVLKNIRQQGIKTKVILPYNNESRLLSSVVDEVVTIDHYARVYKPDKRCEASLEVREKTEEV
jgi:hypothetical protein